MPTREDVKIRLEADAQKLKNELKDARTKVRGLAQQFLELEKTTKKGSTALEQARTKLSQAKAQVDKLARAQRGLTEKTKRSMYQMMEFAENVTTVLFGVGYAFKRIGEQGKDIVLTAARTETLGVVVHQVGKNAGYTKGEIDEFVDGVKKMGITTSAARESIVRMIQAKLDLSYATKLARISQDAAVIADENSSESMRQIIYGIQTHNKTVLKERGLVIDMEGSYKKYAKTMDIVGRQLTEDEKTQAVYNEALERGKDIMGSYEAALETAGKKIKSFERYSEEAKNKFGGFFLPVVNEGIDGVTKLTKAFIKSEEPIQVFSGGIFLAASNLQVLVPIVFTLKTVFPIFTAKIGAASIAMFKFGGIIGAAVGTVTLMITGVRALIQAITTLGTMSLPEWGLGISKTLYPYAFPEGEIKKETKERESITDRLVAKTTREYELKKKQVAEEKKLKDSLKDKTKTGKTGKSPGVESKQEELNLVTLNLAEQKKIGLQIEANVGNIGAIKDLQTRLNELIREEGRLRTGVYEGWLNNLSNTVQKLRESISQGVGGIPEDPKAVFEGASYAMLEMTPIMDALRSSVEALGNSFSNLFQGLIQGSENALEGVKNAMKSIVNAFITSIQAMIIAAAAAMSAKAITSFGLTMITDAPLLAAAWASLEAAKGVISGLAEGGKARKDKPYFVGERGTELFIPQTSGAVISNKDLQNIINVPSQAAPIVNNYINADIDWIKIFDEHGTEYKKFKIKQRVN